MTDDERLKRDLIRFLEWQHDDPEAVAEEALVRAARQVADGAAASADPRVLLFKVAKDLVRDGWKSPTGGPSDRRDAPADVGRRSHETLGRLSARDRRILIRYCTDRDHAAQCRELGVTLRTLRMIVRRILS